MSFTLPSAVQNFLSEYRYKIELHAHTSPVSRCSQLPPAELISRLADKGYHAVVITNHFYDGGPFTKSDDPVETYLADYYTAREAGERAGIRVLLGAEYRFHESDNDYLVYGVDEAFLRETLPRLDMTFVQFYEEYHSDARLIIQAHPFRKGLTVMPADHMDAVEAFNLHPHHNSQIAVAARWGQDNNVPILTAGTDLHNPGYEGLCATRMRVLPQNEAELIDILKSHDYLVEISGCPLLPYARFE